MWQGTNWADESGAVTGYPCRGNTFLTTAELAGKALPNADLVLPAARGRARRRLLELDLVEPSELFGGR